MFRRPFFSTVFSFILPETQHFYGQSDKIKIHRERAANRHLTEPTLFRSGNNLQHFFAGISGYRAINHDDDKHHRRVDRPAGEQQPADA